MNRLSSVRFIILLLFIGVPGFSFAQSVPFLYYNTDARTAALGNTGYVIKSVFSGRINAAALHLHKAKTLEVGSSFLLWQPQVANNKLLNVAAIKINQKMGYGVGYRYNILKTIELSDQNGNYSGLFNPRECALDFSMAYKIMPAVSLGVNLRYINSDMGGGKKAYAFASDASLLYAKPKWQAGFGYTNLGTKINYGNLAYNLPTRIIGGIAYNVLDLTNHTILTTADISYQFYPDSDGIDGGLGTEYVYKKMFALRLGYHMASERVGASYASFGCGICYKRFDLSIAFLQAPENNPVRQSLLVSIKKDF